MRKKQYGVFIPGAQQLLVPSDTIEEALELACDFDKEGVLYLIPDVVDLVEKNYPDIADEAKDGLLLGLEDYLINVLVRAGKLKAAIKQLKDRGAQRIFVKY